MTSARRDGPESGPRPSAPAAPTDLELMMYADGELDAERSAAVDTWLRRDASARAKLAALQAVGGVVRDEAHARAARADDVADAVMSALERDEPKAPMPLEAARRRSSARRRAEGLRSFTLAGAAVLAAAAALLLWARYGEAPQHAQPSATSSARNAAAPADGAREHGVEVWSVDFGSASGAVFYVPSDGSASGTTTVVWVSGDETTGEEDE